MARKSRTMEKTGEAATYSGIMRKTVYFLLVCFGGMAVYFLLHGLLLSGAAAYGGTIVIDNIEGMEGIFSIETCLTEIIAFAAAGIIVLIAPLFAWFFKSAISVVGTLYALCEGYFAGVITSGLSAQYKWIPLVAFVLTAMVVCSMLFIYVKRIVKVTGKFKKTILTLFISVIAGSILLVLLSFIPVLRPIISGMLTFMNSPVISIVLSVVFIVIAALFLLFDFDAIESCVENKMPKKLEWLAAFGLVYTIIYIYFKILNLLIQGAALSKNN